MKQVLCSKCKKRPAMFFISKVDGDKTTQEGLCIKCAMELNIGPISQIIQSMGISEEELEEASEQMAEMFESGDFEPGGAGTMPFLQNFMMNAEQNSNSAEETESTESKSESKEKKGLFGKKKKNEDKEKQRKYISQYCTDLTKRAREGKIDRIIGRENEIYRAVQILCRRSKNNPCLIGEPGVGKTAIAEGLALKIAAQEVPAKLLDKEIQMLDLTALVAGTQFRGQFESRIKGLIEEVKAEGNIILFIDEIHQLVGTGDAEGSMNAANILKPALSRGEIQVIGATTFTEYRKYIEKDAALERRLQPIKVEEPSIDQTTEMLLGVKQYYEEYHKVRVSDTLVRKAVELSERYINDRFLPDKAIDLLDEACTCGNLRNKAISDYEAALKELNELEEQEKVLSEQTENINYEEIAKIKAELIQKREEIKPLEEAAQDNYVTEDDLAKVIQLWTGIPASKVIESDLRKLGQLEDNLKTHLIGQDEAVELVSAAIRRSRIQINPRRKPASFIFVGPTGVGKTELVKLLATELFDTPETLIRLDMSEFMEKHSVSRIIGSPPGYVGYDEAGQLTEKVRRKPYSVVLFDEIEKAHPDVMNILLQILDEGKINDAQGRTVSFENTVIVMTSNAGSNREGGALGFAKSKNEASKERAMKALSEFLRPEFIGRVDEVVLFNDLSQEDYKKIAALLLGELVEPLKDKGIDFKWDDSATSSIAALSVDGTRGARDLRNVIRRNVEDVITTKIIESVDKPIKKVTVTADSDNNIICKF